MTSAPDAKNHDAPTTGASVAKITESDQRILVVEDNEDARKALQKMLQTGVGVTVDAVADGTGAGSRQWPSGLTASSSPTRKMPRMSGMELIKAIQDRRLNLRPRSSSRQVTAASKKLFGRHLQMRRLDEF